MPLKKNSARTAQWGPEKLFPIGRLYLIYQENRQNQLSN